MYRWFRIPFISDNELRRRLEMRRIKSERFSVPKPTTYCTDCMKQTYTNIPGKMVHMGGEEGCAKVRAKFKHTKVSDSELV